MTTRQFWQFDDDAPGWSWERDMQGLGMGLLNSRPINVHRHTDYPEHKKAITEAIDRAFIHALGKAGKLDESEGQPIRVGGRKDDWKEVDGVSQDSCLQSLPSVPSSTASTNWKDIRSVLLEHLGFRGNTAQENYQQFRNHLRIVLLDAYVSATQDLKQWIGFSRNDSAYRSLKSRYNKLRLSKDFLCDAVDLLAGAGFLESWTPEPGARGMQSRFRAKPPLLELLQAVPVDRIKEDRSRTETIVLMGEKDKAGKAKFIEYRDADHHGKPKRWRDNLALINKQIASSVIGIDLDAATMTKYRIDVTRKHLHRVFNNEDWNQGGRFYGAWWIGMKNRKTKFRRRITIDGQPTVELDYAQIHPMMLYVQAGARTVEKDGIRVSLPGTGLTVPADSYVLPGLERDMVKTVFNAMLNVDTRQGMRGAAKKAAIDDAIDEAKEKALVSRVAYKYPDTEPWIAAYTGCIKPIRERHKAIDAAFGTGIGLLLQNVDSQVAEAVMLAMAQRGVTVLPVHDSFIVRAEYEPLLLSIMDSTLHDYFPELARLSDGFNVKVTYCDGTKRVVRSGILRQVTRHREGVGIP